MTQYRDIAELVMRECREAPLPSIEREVRATVIDFCERSRFVVRDVFVKIEAGVRQYDISRLVEGRVSQILQAVARGASGRCRPMRQVDDLFADERSGKDPYQFAMSNDGSQMTISPEPEGTGAVVALKVVVTPTHGTDRLPQEVAANWRDAIVRGTAGRMMGMPDKPWTNKAASERYWAEFEMAVNQARRIALSSGWAPQRTKMRRF